MAKTKKRETNLDMVKRMMDFGAEGAHPVYCQLVIMTAIEKYAEMCLANGKPETFDSPFLSGAQWLSACKAIKAEFDARGDKAEG